SPPGPSPCPDGTEHCRDHECCPAGAACTGHPKQCICTSTGLPPCGIGTSTTCCAGGLTCCGTTCVNLSNNPGNCGACGHVCQPPMILCAGGVCACPVGTTQCGGTCADTTSDPANCGACGHACQPPMVCGGGTCRCLPSEPGSACNTTCP